MTEVHDEKQQQLELQQLKARQFVDSSLDSIQQEVESALALVAAELEVTDEQKVDTADPEGLSPAVKEAVGEATAKLNQVRVALQMAGISVASLLASHIEIAMQRLVERNRVPSVRERNAIFQSFFMFSRYLTAIKDKYGDPSVDVPPILAPSFYSLASAGLAPFVDEHFIAGMPVEVQGSFEALPADIDRAAIRRLRKMYQLALIGLLRMESDEADCTEQLKLIAHVAERLEAQDLHPFSTVCWRLLLQLINAVQAGELALGAQRRHFFARFDKLLRELQKSAPQTLDSEFIASSLGELVYLLQMAGQRQQLCCELPEQIAIGESPWSEQQVNTRRAHIESGLKDALAAMSDVVNELLIELKSRLGVMEESQVCEESDVEFLLQRINAVRAVVEFCGFAKPAAGFRAAEQIVQDWVSSQPDQEALLEVADAVLTVENALLSYSLSGDGMDDNDVEMSLQEGLTHQAHQHLFEELRANIGLANRGISSYLGSNFDNEHIANIGDCLAATVGGLKMIGATLAAQLMENCASLLEQEYKSKIPPNAERLESLADALISTDYMLHELAGGRSVDKMMEQLLQQNIDAINHELAAA